MGVAVIQHDIENLLSSLFFLVQVVLTPVLFRGGGPILSEAFADQVVDFCFIAGQIVTPRDTRDVAQQVFSKTNQQVVDALESKGAKAVG